MANTKLGTFDSGAIKDQALYKSIIEKAYALLAEYDKIPFTPSDDTSRLVNLGKTNLENSVMWAVKGLSRVDR